MAHGDLLKRLAGKYRKTPPNRTWLPRRAHFSSTCNKNGNQRKRHLLEMLFFNTCFFTEYSVAFTRLIFFFNKYARRRTPRGPISLELQHALLNWPHKKSSLVPVKFGASWPRKTNASLTPTRLSYGDTQRNLAAFLDALGSDSQGPC